MSRLIDADARVTVQSFDPMDEEYYHNEMTVEQALDFATDEGCPPIIDAIPVEWLEDRLNTLCFEAMGDGALYGDRIGELAKSINEVMKLWQNEQEER